MVDIPVVFHDPVAYVNLLDAGYVYVTPGAADNPFDPPGLSVSLSAGFLDAL